MKEIERMPAITKVDGYFFGMSDESPEQALEAFLDDGEKLFKTAEAARAEGEVVLEEIKADTDSDHLTLDIYRLDQTITKL